MALYNQNAYAPVGQLPPPPPPPPPPSRGPGQEPNYGGSYQTRYDGYANSSAQGQGFGSQNRYGNSPAQGQGGYGNYPSQGSGYGSREYPQQGQGYYPPQGSGHGSRAESFGSEASSHAPGMSASPHHYSSRGARSPQASSDYYKEFFINVTLDNYFMTQNAASAAKAEGRAKFGRAGSAIGGVLGGLSQGITSLTGSHAVPDGTIIEAMTRALTEEVVDLNKHAGWQSFVVPVMLPPLAGRNNWAYDALFPNNEHFLVYRVQLTRRTKEGPLDDDGTPHSGFWGCFYTCCPPAGPAYNAKSLHKAQYELMQSLKEREQPILANLELCYADEEYQNLAHKWSEELADQVIAGSRQSTGNARF